jgi:TRAP transporter TAXI family solute receptor
MNRRALLLAVCAVGTAQSCTQRTGLAPSRPSPTTILAAGESHGFATALTTLAWPEIGPVRLRATTGSPASLDALELGGASVALASADAATAAYMGTPPMGRAMPVRALARLYDEHLHLVTAADGGPGTVAELRGARVSVGPAGSDTGLVADRLLEASRVDPRTGISRAELDLLGAVEALRRKDIDAFFWSGQLPTPELVQLGGQRPLRLLDLTEPAALLRRQFGTCYRSGAVPADIYPGQPQPVPTLVIPVLLVATDGLPADRAGRLVSAIYTHADRIAAGRPTATRLDRGTAPFTEPVPLHPGALDYYRASKIG